MVFSGGQLRGGVHGQRPPTPPAQSPSRDIATIFLALQRVLDQPGLPRLLLPLQDAEHQRKTVAGAPPGGSPRPRSGARPYSNGLLHHKYLRRWTAWSKTTVRSPDDIWKKNSGEQKISYETAGQFSKAGHGTPTPRAHCPAPLLHRMHWMGSVSRTSPLRKGELQAWMKT